MEGSKNGEVQGAQTAASNQNTPQNNLLRELFKRDVEMSSRRSSFPPSTAKKAKAPRRARVPSKKGEQPAAAQDKQKPIAEVLSESLPASWYGKTKRIFVFIE